MRQFRDYESAQRIVDAPIEVEINLVDGQYIVDSFQNGLFVNRGCTDLFAADPEATHALVISSDETIYVALSTLGEKPRWDLRGDAIQAAASPDSEQPAVVEYIQMSRADVQPGLLPKFPGGAELVAAVLGIEPQGTAAIAMSSSASINR